MLEIERRVQQLTRVNISHSEDTQVLRYTKHGRYLSHNDFFDPRDYSGDRERKMVEDGAKNRMATVFFYLNDVPCGGVTNFPRAPSGGAPIRDFADCTRGVSVTPVKNRVIIFYNLLPNGELDHFSGHGGCKVECDAVKWSANFWIWNKAFPVGRPHAEKMAIAYQGWVPDINNATTDSVDFTWPLPSPDVHNEL